MTSARGLSRAQQQVFEALASEPDPVPLTTLTTTTGLHENTLRDHLAALTRSGLVRRTQAAPHGRGRPAWLWSTQPVTRRSGNEYAGLAAALTRTLLRTSRHARADAIEAGRSWGHDLVDGSHAGSPREQIHTLLDDLGFAPEADPRDAAQTMRLARCPLLELAREHPEIVCNVHLGLVGGALESIGAENIDTELVPFAEPGACLLHLRETAVSR